MLGWVGKKVRGAETLWGSSFMIVASKVSKLCSTNKFNSLIKAGRLKTNRLY
jgi:hypothetical protein